MRLRRLAPKTMLLLAVTLIACAGKKLEPDNSTVNADPNNQADANNTPSNNDAGNVTPINNVGDLFDNQEPMTIVQEGTRGFLLHGIVLTHDGLIDGGHVLVIGPDIVCVGECTTDPDAGNATWIATGGIISPGLIDGHNHLAYNFLPEWVPPNGQLFQNRYQWADDPSYEAHIAPYATHRVNGTHVCPSVKWAELRSIMHATTTVMGQSPNQTCMQGWVRNADHEHRLAHDHLRTSISSPREVDDETAANFIESIDAPFEPTTRIAVHMQEGYAEDNVLLEFESWAGRDDRMNRHMGTSLLHKETSVLIHAMSLTPEQLDEVAQTGSKVVWSPSSNMVLYNQTAPIEEILSRGIATGIGPDWTVSGEDELLSELRFARDFAVQRGIAALSPQKLWQMATDEGAFVVGLDGHVGRIEVGYRADIAVFSPVEADPHQAIINNRAKDISLVMINGEAYYGPEELTADIGRNNGCEPIDVCGVAKFICARDSDYTDGAEGVSEIRQRLVDILEGNGYPPEEQYGRGDDLLELIDCDA